MIHRNNCFMPKTVQQSEAEGQPLQASSAKYAEHIVARGAILALQCGAHHILRLAWQGALSASSSHIALPVHKGPSQHHSLTCFGRS